MANQLQIQQISDFKEAFALFDLDGDGRINAEELGLVIRSLGENPTEAQLEVLINELDTNGDGFVDFSEFLTFMNNHVIEEDDEEELRKAFRVFDHEGTGKLSIKEVEHLLKSFGEKSSGEEIEQIIKEAELEEGGYIKYEDFAKIMKSK